MKNRDEEKISKALVLEKVVKVRRLFYVAPAKVTSEIDVFGYPKDQMIFDYYTVGLVVA